LARVHVFTDSTADIPKELQQELGIHVIPLKIHLDQQTYLDRETISPAEFYQKLEEVEQLPTTSQPSPMDFSDAYKRAIADGAKDIISIHLSSALSGTYQSAVLAKGIVAEEIPDVNITVIDSRSASYGTGGAVVATARAAQEGKSVEECLSVAKRYLEQQKIYFLVDTLEYLQRGGRIGKAAALVGSMLNIKPILSFNKEGEIIAVDKVRGKKKAFGRILELIKETAPAGPLSIAVAHANVAEEAERWISAIEKQSGIELHEKVITDVGPVVGAHAGPGTLAYFLFPSTKEDQ
jgi:DegV family protein with EDD domain